MPKQKKIAYKKCNQCRKDRQKCLPEKRDWPGPKCDRCQHYNYECSAMRTKDEESLMTSNALASNSPDIPSTTGSASPPIRRSESRCLQDLGDLQHLYMILHEIWPDRDDEPFWEMDGFLDEALCKGAQEIMIWARRHEAGGRYRDAEYLIRRAIPGSHGEESLKHMCSHLSENVLRMMAPIYEGMGDYAAGEERQERLVKSLFFAKSQEQVNEEQIQAVVALSRLLSNFLTRVLDLVPNFGESDLFITYRAAVLDVVLLNEVLLEQGLIKSETQENHHGTSLHIAAKENATNLARQLIEMDADVNSEDEFSRTPLHIAARYAGFEMIELLLNNKAKVEVLDNLDNTPLHAAVLGERPEENVAHLVNAKVDINARNIIGYTALCLAIRYNGPEIVSLLLEQGASVEATDHGEPPLFTAVREQKTWAIKLLLDNGANLLEKNRAGYNVLDVAMKMDREYRKPIVKILLDRTEKTRSTSYEENDYEGPLVLHYAIETGNVPMVEMLLKARVGIHARDHGDTALHQAIREGGEPHERIIQLLLEHDAVDMQRVNLYGETALHLAVTHSRLNMLGILLRHKLHELPILCNIQNNDGERPLDIARNLAKNKMDVSVEVSILHLLEDVVRLVSATGLHKGTGEEPWNSDLV